jgi:hypothetical protein
LGGGDAGGGKNCERRQHATTDAVSDSTAPGLLTAIVGQSFLRVST